MDIMCGDGCELDFYCGGHFVIHTNIESLCYTTGTTIMLYVNYASVFFKEFYEVNRYIELVYH